MSTHTRLDEMAVKVKEIRQLTGVRQVIVTLAYDDQEHCSAKIQEERDIKHAKRNATTKTDVGPEAGRSSSPVKSPLKKKRPPPGSPKKIAGGRKKATAEEKNK